MPLNATSGYACIRRSERLAKKAAYFEQSFSVPPIKNTVENSPVREASERQSAHFRRSFAPPSSSFSAMEQKLSPRGTFGRRSVRKSIRRSFQPIANMLSAGRRRKEEKSETIYENRAEMAERRSYRNTVCISTPELDTTVIPEGPQSPRFRVPKCPRPERKVLGDAPKPMPRTSVLRQENAPPVPPRRQTIAGSRRLSAENPLKDSLKELQRLEPQLVLRTLREIPVNSPKRRICVEPCSAETADDENSGLENSLEKKRRRTVRYQEGSAWPSRGNNDAVSGKAKLQLSVYVNHGHISLHVVRGANLPLLPDQHELNSYIKVAVEPRDCRVQHRSQIVPGTVDPTYDLRLSFEIPPQQDEDPTLLLTVWHRDPNTRQSRLLGFLSFPIRKIIEANRIEGWFRLPSLAITKRTQL